MKKIIKNALILISIILSASFLKACFADNSNVEYLGMTVEPEVIIEEEQPPVNSDKKLTDKGPNIKDYYETVVGQNILLTVVLNNPRQFEILSFTLNGYKYQSYEFQEGSDGEHLILILDVGDSIGVIKYTVDAIKYIDKQAVKDAKMTGNKTIWVNVLPKEEVLEYVVQFHSNGAALIDDILVVEGNLVTPPIISLNGYIFGGWYEDQNLTNKYDFTLPVMSDLELWAKWEEIPKVYYTVVFNANGGTAIANLVIEEKQLVLMPNISRNGYIFAGWYLDFNFEGKYNFNLPVVSDLELWAKWEEVPKVYYTVKFHTNGGNSIQNMVVQEGNMVVQPFVQKDGYTLVGWYSNSELTEKYNFMSAITQDLELWAKWEETIQTLTYYTVVFHSNGGNAVQNAIVESGKTVSPPSVTRSGYILDGWYIDATLINQYDFTSLVTSDLELRAKWIVILPTYYNVVFYSNGGNDIKNILIESGQVVSPVSVVREGYTFDGWYISSDLTLKYDFSAPVFNNLELWAKWTKLPAVYFTVTFNSNGGNEISSLAVESGQTISPPSVIRSGYTLVGWYSDLELTKRYSFTSLVIENLDLWAKWEEIPIVYYNVTFNTNGGGTNIHISVKEGQQVYSPFVTREGFILDGWFSDSTFKTEYDFSSQVESDLNLWAKWSEIPLTYYIVKFNTNGGNFISDIAVESGKTVFPPSVTKVGFILEGWYKNEDLTEAFSFVSAITSNIQLWAKWTELPYYTVTFVTNGGDEIDNVSIREGNKLLEPAITRNGYVLEGWYLDQEFLNKYDFTRPVLNDLKLWAKWLIDLTKIDNVDILAGGEFQTITLSQYYAFTATESGYLTFNTLSYQTASANYIYYVGLYYDYYNPFTGTYQRWPEEGTQTFSGFSGYITNHTMRVEAGRSYYLRIWPYSAYGQIISFSLYFTKDPSLQ